MTRSPWTTPLPQTQTRIKPWSAPQPAWMWHSKPVESLAADYAPISLAEMDGVALLDRVDTKFVLTMDQLFQLVSALRNDYRMLSIHGQRLNHYRTLYFDTENFSLYHAQVNGLAERYKVRSREYVDSRLSFLEVKHRTRKDRTIKERISTPRPLAEITPEVTGWLDGVVPFSAGTLAPKLENTFTRMTLVSKRDCERVTLDLDLMFFNADKVVSLDGIAVAELKMDANNPESAFLKQMRAQRIQPKSFSKYSIGVAMLYDQVKKNALKPKMLWIEKMMKG